jgi:hypothetical protein
MKIKEILKLSVLLAFLPTMFCNGQTVDSLQSSIKIDTDKAITRIGVYYMCIDDLSL